MRRIRATGGGRQHRAVVLAAVLAVAGLVGSVALGVSVAAGQQRNAAAVMDRRTELITEAVAAETGRYVDTLRTAAGAIGGFDNLTATNFAQVAAPLTQMRLAGATSLVYLVPAEDADIAATQRRWRSRGAGNLTLRPHPGAAEHLFTIFSRPVDGSAPAVTGIDAAQSPAPAQALAEARRSGQVTVSDTYHLILDKNLPVDRRQLSFVLTAPVYGPAAATGTRPFRGWLLLGLRGHDFIGATMSRVSQDLVDVTLHATAADGTLTRVAAQHTGPGHRDLHRRADVPVAQRHWQLSVDATATTLPGSDHGGPVLTIAGLLLTTLLTALVFTLATSRARAQAQVDAATAELHAGEQILQQQKSDLTAFAGVVAHDLKAPLTAVRGLTEIVADTIDDGDDPATIRPTLNRITAAATRMGALIDDLLAYATARDAALHPVDLDLHELADEVVITHLDAAVATGAPVPVVYIGDLPTVPGDAVLLRQLLHNLIGNAIKYTPAGQTPRLDITAATGDDQVRLEIADRGIGIPAGHHDAVFHSFHRAHPAAAFPGTGLGLAICQRIAERHGGTITAGDNPGGGTRITVLLPTTDTTSTTAEQHPPTRPPGPRTAEPRRSIRSKLLTPHRHRPADPCGSPADAETVARPGPAATPRPARNS